MDRALPIFVIAALAAQSAPAYADFYSVEGRFQCLDRPGAVCFDAVIPRGPSLLDETPPPAPPAAIVAAPSVQTREAAAERATTAKPPDPVLAIAQRVKRGEPEAGDVGALRRAADAGDSRALELLAWCFLRGIGTPADAMAAYDLYGKAAAARVPHAAENQQLVFEGSLSSDERQHLLERAARLARAQGISAEADEPEIP